MKMRPTPIGFRRDAVVAGLGAILGLQPQAIATPKWGVVNLVYPEGYDLQMEQEGTELSLYLVPKNAEAKQQS